MIIETQLDSTRASESVCLMAALGIHGLALFWNPVILRSHFKATHDFVTVDVIDQAQPTAPEVQQAPKKMSLMATLKDMLMTSKQEEIAHVAPEPMVAKVAAPVQPALKERTLHSLATMFQPKSQDEDLAAARAPDSIQTPTRNIAMPTAAPVLQSKSFGGIKMKDMPFQMGAEQELSAGNATIIPVAVGSHSAKAALGYSNPALQDAGKHRGVLTQKLGGPVADFNAIGAGAPSTIQISGTGGTGNAPLGASQGSVLQNRAGSGSGGGFVSRTMFGGGGHGGTISGLGNIPSAAADLDRQLAQATASVGRGQQPKKSFEIAGPLGNRGITHKTVPQYPSWAEEQGIIGSVRIWFTVATDGTVRSNMRVTKTTGYPDLDKLAMDALRQWTFTPFDTADEGSQWGIITFTFSLAS